MRHESFWNTLAPLEPDRPTHEAEEYVWSTSEQSKLRALSLFIIRSIVEKHGGTVEVDLATDTLNIDVPQGEETACAKEIEEQVGQMCA
jgi:hypothetical protein